MSLTTEQQSFMDAVTEQGGGKDIHELMNELNMTYTDIEKMVYALVSKGIKLRAFRAGGYNGWIKRIYLSPYQEMGV